MNSLHLTLATVLLLTIRECFSEEETKKQRESCSQFDLKTLWKSRLRESPLMATPLLIDVDGDSLRDIIAPSYSGEVWAIHGENGHIVDNWPFYVEDRAFFASPLAYDVDRNGQLDIVLTTTDAEVLFLRVNNTLFHGDTIKIPPLRVRRDWYSLEKDYIERLAAEMTKQVGNRFKFNPNPSHKPIQQEPPPSDSDQYSQFDSYFGHDADTLFSRHQPGERPVGLDPNDNNYVFVEPHVLATPVIIDINEDGEEDEMIVPISYYFDKYQYGLSSNLIKTGLRQEELVNYGAAGIVIVSLKTKQIIKQRLLSLTKLSSDQPAYLLAPPTVVRLSKGEPLSTIIGSTAGQLHVLQGLELQDAPGFPVTADSIIAQVAVEDLTGDGNLELVVGDKSGNIICVDKTGKQLWEYNVKMPIELSARFANFHADSSMEVAILSKFGDLWIINGTTGKPTMSSPMSLNTIVHSSPLLIHLSSPKGGYHLSAIVPSLSGIYIVDLYAGCVDHVTTEYDFIPHTLQSDHIDPFNPGLEILATSLSGELICFSTGTVHPTDYEVSVETWPSDTLGGNGFTHKESTFVLVCGRSLSPRDAHGKSFSFSFEIHDKKASEKRPHYYTALLSVGRKYILLNESLKVTHTVESINLNAVTPPIPILAMMVLEVCNEHRQCDAVSFNVRFNLLFQENLCWCLALPFLALVAAYLWLLRNESDISLPTVYEPQKRL